MTDQADREHESQESPVTKFEEATDSEEDEQHQLAQRLGSDPLVNEPQDDED